MQSAELVAALVEMEDRPWPEWRHGKAMTAAGLAPQRGEIEVAHIRYCPPLPSQSGTLEQMNEVNDLAAFQSGTSARNVPVSRAVNPLENNDCSGVPVCEGGVL